MPVLEVLVGSKPVGLMLVWTVVGEWKEADLGVVEPEIWLGLEGLEGVTRPSSRQERPPLRFEKWQETRRPRMKRTKSEATCHMKRMETHSKESGYV